MAERHRHAFSLTMPGYAYCHICRRVPTELTAVVLVNRILTRAQVDEWVTKAVDAVQVRWARNQLRPGRHDRGWPKVAAA